MPKGPRTPRLAAHHTWSGNVATIFCIKTVHGKSIYPTVSLDLDALGVARGGLLEVAIRSAPCPLNSSYAGPLQQVLNDVAGSSQAVSILSTPVNKISRPQLHGLLFEAFENAIEKWSGGYKYSRFMRARHIFTLVNVKLATGESISESGFKSRFPRDNTPTKQLLSEDYDSSFDQKELAAPISATDFENLPELNRKALTHLESRLNRVTSACHKALNDFCDVRQRIYDSQAAPPPSEITELRLTHFRKGRGPTRKVYDNLSESSRFWVAANLVLRDELHKSYFNKSLSLAGLSGLMPVCHTLSNKVLFTALLSTHYLPRSTLIACLLLTMAPTPWNASVVLSMTSDNIKINRDGTYTISGMKTRTAQLQERTLTSLQDEEWQDIEAVTDACDINDEYACKALGLLLWHDRNLKDANVTRSSDSLFVTLNLGKASAYTFDIIDLSTSLSQFCQQYDIPTFIPSSIRDQVASIEYLRSNRDVHYVSALLGHADLHTTQRYLNSTIIKLLNAANMKRFMDHLSASIIFACGGMERVVELNFDPAKVREQMLFPSSPTSPETGESLADKWLDSVGDMAICITEVEIQHCVLQHRFYSRSLRTLIQFNLDRFCQFHLPRVIFCQALYKLISASPYCDVLRDYEETLNAA
ncbi:protein of unknown function [Paraburkholderia kururiensis]|uniref:hypothetical protein n=1 Tax=Paraburkholderia kururiensis TaxID=984307 RepID=UPI0039A5B874